MEFPYYQGKTYAEIIGKEYYIYHGMFIMGAFLMFTFSSIQCFRVWFNTKIGSHILQKRMLTLVTIMSVCFFVQSIDPQGYSGNLPQMIEVIAADITTLIGLILLFVFISILNKLFKLDIPIDKNIDKESVFWITLAIITFIGGIVLSVLQVIYNRAIFRGTKLIVFSVLLTIAYIRTDILLYNMYKYIVDCKSTIELRFRLIRLKIHTVLFNIIVPIIIVIQMIYGIKEILEGSNVQPKLSFEQYLFPLFEMLTILLTTSYTSKIEEEHILPPIIPKRSVVIPTSV